MTQGGLGKLFIVQSVIFSAIALSFILPNGNFSCVGVSCTLSIGNWHMHDALWHISLAKLGFNTWPLTNPYMAGQTLTGYNFLLDYLLHLLTKIGISPFVSFFKLLPILATAIYVFSVTSYIKSVTANKIKANILAFFLYFGSSATYLATLYAGKTFYYASLRGFPVVSVINPSTMFLNLQFAFSLSVFLWIMIVRKWGSSWGKNLLLLVLFFIMFGFKFYGGAVALAYYLGTKGIDFIRKRRLSDLFSIFPVLLGSSLGLLLFYGLSKNPEFPFVWSPLSLTHLMIDDNLLFGNHSLTLARYYLYENSTSFSPRLWAIEGVSIILFLIINFGTRLLGIYYAIKQVLAKKLSPEQVVITLVILLTAVAPILFVQSGGWYNTMQFLYYGTWLAGLLSAELVFELVSNKSLTGWILVLIIILLTIPNCLEQLRFIKEPQSVVSSDEMSALALLQKQPDGIVHVSESVHKQGLVPALAEKSTYYLDTDQLMVTHVNYEDRLAYINKYSGGSISMVIADYYLIYKADYGSTDAMAALSSRAYDLLYDSSTIALYKKLK